MKHFGAVRHLRATQSTNDEILPLLGEPQTRGLTIVADFQTHGKGRKGRPWIAAPESSLLFTTALPEPIAARDLWVVPFWIALVVREALEKHNVTVELQWPNDLLLRGRKVGGILCVSRTTGIQAWAACGVGINLVRAPGFQSDIDPQPAFLCDARPVERDALLQTILQCANKMYDRLQFPRKVAAEWETAAGLPGAQYHLLIDGEGASFEATALRLGDEGQLIVQSDGKQSSVALAQARVLRT